jgi:GTPase SAR1 family protein
MEKSAAAGTPMKKNHIFKIIILGDCAVGKTSIINK